MIDILIPTYGRAERLRNLADNVAATTSMPYHLYFVIEGEDEASVQAVAALHGETVSAIVNRRARNYSGAINTAYDDTGGDMLFCGADDLKFHSGWDTFATKKFDGWVGVVGTNDLLNPYVQQGSHATHYLVLRKYLDEVGGIVDGGPGSFLFEGYTHQFTDTEFIGTAKMRARFRPCFESIVEHMHWSAGKSPQDATSEKAFAHLTEDEALYNQRRELWFNLSR